MPVSGEQFHGHGCGNPFRTFQGSECKPLEMVFVTGKNIFPIGMIWRERGGDFLKPVESERFCCLPFHLGENAYTQIQDMRQTLNEKRRDQSGQYQRHQHFHKGEAVLGIRNLKKDTGLKN